MQISPLFHLSKTNRCTQNRCWRSAGSGCNCGRWHIDIWHKSFLRYTLCARCSHRSSIVIAADECFTQSLFKVFSARNLSLSACCDWWSWIAIARQLDVLQAYCCQASSRESFKILIFLTAVSLQICQIILLRSPPIKQDLHQHSTRYSSNCVLPPHYLSLSQQL